MTKAKQSAIEESMVASEIASRRSVSDDP